ncbi:exosome non-catalytic core subunit rrp40 [Tulasnella sp. JGI-2019a]|nr:exosome non-catalytic core subunit rrp40 [Tulasnella sp. JGI-2019a]KAG9034511.1 exosome non-catalytic core subunit rrp40 [Tulasnella sp. JGI-2019a]
MSSTTKSFVLPGDAIPIEVTTGKHIKIGPGLFHVTGSSTPGVIIATRAGTLESNLKKKEYWIDSNATRYSPAAQESVIGIVTAKSADGYRVDIGSAHTAYLDALSFEGASKRNKPNLKVGSTIYARVSLAHKDMEPELECFDAQSRKAEGFGELKGGFVVQCGLKLCRRLFDPEYFLLPTLGATFPIEVVIGTNGRVWTRTTDSRGTIAVARCIEAVDALAYDERQIKSFLNTMDLP